MSLSPSAVVFPGSGLTVFHTRNDEGGLDTLWYTSFDGTNWTTPDLELPFILLGSSPSAVLMPDGGISVFYQGFGGITAGSGQLWCAYFDGKNWVSNTQVPGVGMSYSPSAVVF